MQSAMTTTRSPDLQRLIAQLQQEAAAPTGPILLCRFCHAPVARAGDALRIGPHHQYHFSNPYGIRFQVGCYRQAPGCDIHGEPTAADTWFRGYQWRLALCGDCHEHLGWYFQRDEQRDFFGLIVDKLIGQL